VLVSSHLLAEVAQTAGQVIVIDHGRLTWSGPASRLTTATGQAVVVRAPRAAELRAALEAGGAAVRELADGRLEITGAAVEQVATLAAARGLPIFEITEETGSLEEAFLTLTAAESRPG
jgi:ABC-2 type transport system ATP-binding protein